MTNRPAGGRRAAGVAGAAFAGPQRRARRGRRLWTDVAGATRRPARRPAFREV